LVVSLIAITVGLVVSIVSRFFGHGHMKTTTFWDKGKNDDDNNININMQPNNEGEKAKGGWALCNLFFLGFVLW
jgi:hypothetical protein